LLDATTDAAPPTPFLVLSLRLQSPVDGDRLVRQLHRTELIVINGYRRGT
jgi:hypothetical protein